MGTRTCVHTGTVEDANVGSSATKVGNKVGSRTIELSWLHAVTRCLAKQNEKHVGPIRLAHATNEPKLLHMYKYL